MLVGYTEVGPSGTSLEVHYMDMRISPPATASMFKGQMTTGDSEAAEAPFTGPLLTRHRA
jgi:hypothetical protein